MTADCNPVGERDAVCEQTIVIANYKDFVVNPPLGPLPRLAYHMQVGLMQVLSFARAASWFMRILLCACEAHRSRMYL